MRTELKLKRMTRRLLKKVGKHGTAIAHPYWYEEKEIVRDIKIYKGKEDLKKFREDFPSAEEGGMEKAEYRAYIKDLEEDESIEIPVEYEDYKFRGVKVDVIDRRDFIIHKDIINLDEAKVMGQRIWQGWYDIVGRYEAGEYGEDNGGESLELLIDKLGGDKEITKKDKKPEYTTGRYQCIKAIWKYDIDDCKKRQEKLLVSIIKDDKATHLLRCEYYDFWHNRDFFIAFRIDEGDGFDGEGFTEKLWDTNLYANAMHNGRVDAGTIANIPMFKGMKGSEAQESKLEFAKGIIYWLDNPDAFEQIRIQNPPISDLAIEEQMLERWAELTTGITHSASGRESPTDPTAPATKTLALLQQQDIGIADYIDCLDPSFAELSFQILSLYWQFGFNDEEGKETIIRELVGDKYGFNPVSREDLKVKGMEFSLRCSTGGMNELLEEAKFKEIMAILIQQPEFQQDRARFWKLIRELIDKVGLQLSSDLIPTAEEMEKQQKERMKEALRELVKERMQGISEEARAEIQRLLGVGLPTQPEITPTAPIIPEGGERAEITPTGL